MLTFTLVNGGDVPRLDGSNFFGWYLAIYEAAYAGGFINVLNGLKSRPVVPSKPFSSNSQERVAGASA